jgi:hypothetical protein
MRTIDGELRILEWTDERQQPSDEEIDAVSDQDAEDKILDTEAEQVFSFGKMAKLQFEVYLKQENRIRILEGKDPLTRGQFTTGLKDLYKAL